LQGIKGCPEHHHQGPVHRLRPRGAGVRAAAPRICESHRLHWAAIQPPCCLLQRCSLSGFATPPEHLGWPLTFDPAHKGADGAHRGAWGCGRGRQCGRHDAGARSCCLAGTLTLTLRAQLRLSSLRRRFKHGLPIHVPATVQVLSSGKPLNGRFYSFTGDEIPWWSWWTAASSRSPSC